MTGNEREGCLRVRIDGDALDDRWVLPPGREVVSAGEALARVLTAWQANPLRSYAHIWRVVDIDSVDDADGVLLVRRPDQRVHLVGAGGVGEDLRGLLRAGVDGWRLHELPAAQTPLQDAAALLGPRVYAMLTRYGFGTLEELAAVPNLGLLDIRHFGRKTQLVVDAALATHQLLDDPAARAAHQRRRQHIDQQLSAAHRARNAPLLDVLARSDLELSAVDSILASLAAEAVPPADPTVLQLLGESDRPDLAALYARTHTPAEPRSPSRPAEEPAPSLRSPAPCRPRRHRNRDRDR